MKVLTSPSDDRGAAAVEFALVLPLLLLMVFGLLDFGRAYNMQITLTQAAREGVRVAALGGTPGEATTRTTNAAAPTITTGINVAVTPCPATVTPTDDAQVLATRQYNYITPIQPIFALMGQPGLAAPVITGRGRMRCNG